ncbi:hypothetical protein [Staphylococcus epidermidis]|uniref:hypothetical protein n=1 Tax=Staphylococcus epidermidis TaxID=1282 RepID=UPI003F687BE8
MYYCINYSNTFTIVTPLFAIGSIIYSVKDKKYDEVKGAKLLQISIIVAAIIFF